MPQINDFAVHDFANPSGDAALRLRLGAPAARRPYLGLRSGSGMPLPRFFREMQACGQIYPAHLLHINKTVAGPSLLLLSFLFGLPVVGLQMINHHLSASHFPSQGHQHRLGAGPLG